ncbi:hypothetical protein JXA63_05195 [Candidatus Woesebacteria bacterium]|nr:hypothetical protein [Candidatus Woesebacteria bacterium]
MKDKLRNFTPVLLFSLLPTILVWIPFYLRLDQFWTIPLPKQGMETIVANYDGPLFLVVAKTLYNPELINQQFQFSLPDIYYSAHYPLFPLLIRLVGLVINYPYAMLIVTLISSIVATNYFRKLVSMYVDKKHINWMLLVFSILPARWLIVRSVGSAEPLFIASIIASLYYFVNKKYIPAAFWGVLAQLTKSPGILLFISYFFAVLFPSLKNVAFSSLSEWFNKLNIRKTWPIILIPISLLGLFYFYGVRYGDFYAYFNSGDNIHLFFPPFQIFNYSAPWVGTFWLEEIIFVYLIGSLGFLKLVEKKLYPFAWFVGIYFFSILFVSHRDIIRYTLPIVPFLLIGWCDLISKRHFKIAFAVIIIPVYLFSLSYISQNVMPISDWAPFL